MIQLRDFTNETEQVKYFVIYLDGQNFAYSDFEEFQQWVEDEKLFSDNTEKIIYGKIEDLKSPYELIPWEVEGSEIKKGS